MVLGQIDRVNDISQSEFEERYYKPQKPLIFRSFAKDWQATKQWNFELFKNLAGSESVDVFGDWKKTNSTRIKMPPATQMQFGEYLDVLEKGDSELRLFLFDLFKLAPELKQDFDFPKFGKKWVKAAPFLFFGGGGSDVRLHYDIDWSNVFLTQFQGAKKVTLFSPQMSKYLYKQPYSSHSSVDIKNPDYDNYPALRHLQGLEGVIEHGDTVFMPSGYWHYIEYLSSGYGMALRSINTSYVKVMQGAYNAFVMKRMDDWISNRYQHQWTNYKLKKAKYLAER